MQSSFAGLSLSSCATICLAAATPVRAQSIGYIGTLGGSISSVEDYNSAGGVNTATITGSTFQVVLPGLGNGLNSNVQVSATNTNGRAHYCTVINWFSSNGVDVTVNVACFDISGNPLLADFALFYQARTTRPTGADVAFVWANRPHAASYKPAANYTFNSIGGPNTITRSSPGNYTVILGDFLANDSNVQVTAYGNTAARCQVTGWMGVFADGSHVGVHCVNAANTPTDEFFSLSYALGGVEGSGHAVGAFAWANNPKSKNYIPKKSEQFSNISQAQFLTAQRFGGAVQGQYELSVPNPGNLSFSTLIGMVTSYGSSGEFCDTDGIFLEPPDIALGVICYDSAGRQLNTQYSATLMATP